MGANCAGKTAKRPRTKRRALTPVKRGPQDRQSDVRNDASVAMMPAPQLQQWQWRIGDVCNDASAVTATMPKRRQGNVRNDASAAIQHHDGNDGNGASAMSAMMIVQCLHQCQQDAGDDTSGNFAEEGKFAR
jgi:hypothetical protein